MSAPIPPSALGRIEAAGDVFTASLSVDELAVLADEGFTPVGVAMGTGMQHVGFQVQRWNQSVELGMITQAMATARTTALARLEAEAMAMHADGVVAVTLETLEHEGAGDVLEFVARGTAVRGGSGEGVFTTQLSGHELGTLKHLGYAPAGVVIGVCVYHVAHQAMRQALSPNVELPQYSQAYYDGRELAMTRLQAAASSLHAAGVVGVSVDASSQIWRQHAVEFVAVGSAVRSV